MLLLGAGRGAWPPSLTTSSTFRPHSSTNLTREASSRPTASCAESGLSGELPGLAERVDQHPPAGGAAGVGGLQRPGRAESGALPGWGRREKASKKNRATKREVPAFNRHLPVLNTSGLTDRRLRRAPHTCCAFPAPEIGPGRLYQATPTDPELTPARRCWPLFGNFRRGGRYPSTCHRQKVEWGFRMTIGTSQTCSLIAQP